MPAIEAQTFPGYGRLRQGELPKPQPAKSRVLVRLTAAGVTSLDYRILSGGHPRAKAPLVLGNEALSSAARAGSAHASKLEMSGTPPPNVQVDPASEVETNQQLRVPPLVHPPEIRPSFKR